jgi:hypothetical protein
VSEEHWSDFVACEITPRFPASLTIDDALGQWHDAETGHIVREPSKEFRLIVPGGSEVKDKIVSIVAAHKERSPATAVGSVIRPACASF